MPVDPNSANLIASIGLNTGLHPDFGTVYQRRAQRHSVHRSFRHSNTGADQPRNAMATRVIPVPIRCRRTRRSKVARTSNGDRHVLVIDRDNWKLYELGRAFPINSGASWNADCGAIFDLNSQCCCGRRAGPRPMPRDCRSFPGWCVTTKSSSRV